MEVNVEQVAVKMAADRQGEHYDLSDGSRVSRYTLRTLRLVYHMSDQALADIFGVSEQEFKALEKASGAASQARTPSRG